MDSNGDHESAADASQGLAEFLKSAAHPARVHVLTLLQGGEHAFGALMRHTAMSKTALANHLSRLVGMGLIQRVARGDYALTTDGEALLKATERVYRDSVRREAAQREAVLTRYTKSMIEGKTVSKTVISNAAVYQPCWLSYTGAMAGALRSLGATCDTIDVGGYSGYAYLVNVAKGMTCPSGPTALPLDTWRRIHRGTEVLGWTLEHYEYPASYPKENGHPTPEEIEVARKLFAQIKQEIDKHDRPVVLWGLVVPEYGIVNGYEGSAYLVSTFRSLGKQPETPIPFHDLKAPGCIDAFFFRDPVTADAETMSWEVVQRAVQFATADVPILDNYVAGPPALEEWARVLETVPAEKQNYHGNSYVGVCVAEGRAMASKFLERLAAKQTSRQAKHLVNAGHSYAQGARLMEQFAKVFPFKFEGPMPLDARKQGAELLRKTKHYEEDAIRHMQLALDNWDR